MVSSRQWPDAVYCLICSALSSVRSALPILRDHWGKGACRVKARRVPVWEIASLCSQ
jgi:hypothetical protein